MFSGAANPLLDVPLAHLVSLLVLGDGVLCGGSIGFLV
jgi:hypothetical protein